MISACPGYAALGARVRDDPGSITDAELRDLQVFSTLAWFGATARADFPELAALSSRGGGFSEGDKAVVLHVQREILRALPGRLREAVAGGTPFSVSPFHHPILPLLVDLHHARRCGQDVPEELRYAWPEDARGELDAARRDAVARFGRAPAGLWPSEGAVSPEVVQLAAEAGFRWLVSDEGVLRQSDGAGRGLGPWELGHGVVGFFRDHGLSDRIGFHYATWDPRRAAEDLVGRARARGGLVVLALDGENPWESFPEAGAPFRRELRRALASTPGVRAVSMDEAASAPPCGRVDRLHTGSWIGADLRVWAGDAADLAAWRRLAAVRRALDSAPRPEAGRAKLGPALGSDWFWWLGPEHHTPFAATFDELFRAHLRAACEAAGVAPPVDLDTPCDPGVRVDAAPCGWIDPVASRPPAWEDWRGAGVFHPASGGSMASGDRPFSEVAYGWDDAGAGWLWWRWAGPARLEGVVIELGHEDGRVDAWTGPQAAWGAWGLVVRSGSATRARVRGAHADGATWAAPAEGWLELPAPPERPALRWWSA
jgi:alpha-amylase/alpha-mannosidase (GH57 family)